MKSENYNSHGQKKFIEKFISFARNSWPQAVAMAILSLGLVYRFYLSISKGRAGAEPAYDDIVYLLDGRYRLEQLNLNFFKGIQVWVTNPPHSPSSSLISLVGQLISGSNAPFVYLLNALVITSCSYVLFKKIAKNNLLATYFTSILIISPTGPMLMFNFRPDCLYAIILGIMIVSAFDGDANKSIRTICVYVCFLFLIKPSFIVFTLLDGVLLIFLLRLSFGKRRINLVYLAKTFLIVAVLSGWYLIKGLSRIINYIFSTISTQGKTFWTTDGYYKALTSNLENIASQIGVFWFFTLIIVFAVALIRNRRSLVKANLLTALLVLGFFNLAISVYCMIANPFFYLTTLVPFFVAMVLSIRENWPKLLLGSQFKIMLLSIPFFIFTSLLPSVEWSASAIRSEGPVGKELAMFVRDNQIGTVRFLYAGGLNPDTTKWYLGDYAKEVLFIPEGFNYVDEAGAIEILEKNVKMGELILTRRESVTGFPSDKLQTFVNQRLAKGLNGVSLKNFSIGNYQLWLIQ